MVTVRRCSHGSDLPSPPPCPQALECSYEMTADVELGRVEEPTQCSSCQSKFSMRLIHNRSRFDNKQMIKLQESPDHIPEGETPHTCTLFAHNDLVDACKPGDRVVITVPALPGPDARHLLHVQSNGGHVVLHLKTNAPSPGPLCLRWWCWIARRPASRSMTELTHPAPLCAGCLQGRAGARQPAHPHRQVHLQDVRRRAEHPGRAVEHHVHAGQRPRVPGGAPAPTPPHPHPTCYAPVTPARPPVHPR